MNFNDAQWIFVLATLSGALGLWLLLPRGTAGGRAAGAVLAAVALGLWASRLFALRDPVDGRVLLVDNGLFFILAGITLAAAVGAVTMRNPVYCAIWFGMSLLGTAGLFLLSGAQFLAVATVVVYAGAILVTFLFVLMLAQTAGRAHYDRVSWEAMISAVTGMVIVGVLSMTIAGVLTAKEDHGMRIAAADEAAGRRDDEILAPRHVAHLGAELFGRHLVAVEVAGTLLLAALVGAAVIVTREKSDPEEKP